MRLAILLLISVAAFGQAMPNAKLTPGKTRDVSVKELCTTSTRAVRHTTPSMKRQVCREYGITSGCPGKAQEIDHLISLEIGGADDVTNLWPQSYQIPGAHQKDVLENFLHRQVCSRKMTLADAQDCIRTNWYKCYVKYGFAKEKKQ